MTTLCADLRELAAPYPRGDKVKRAIERAAIAAGFEYWRTFDLWYGKTRRIEEHERLAVATALEKKREQEVSNELHDLRLRLLRLESLHAQKNPNFARAASHPLRENLRRMGGAGRAQDRTLD